MAGCSRRPVLRGLFQVLLSFQVIIAVVLIVEACDKGGGGGAAANDAGTESGNGDGGIIASLPGVGLITFPAGALPPGTDASVAQLVDEDTFAEFADTASIYRPTTAGSYSVRITTGTILTSAPPTVVLSVPGDVRPVQGEQLALFGRVYTQNEEEELDSFELIPGTFDAAAGTYTATIPTEFFTSGRSSDGTVEVVLVLAARLQSFSGTAPIGQSQYCIDPGQACPVACMHSPVRRTLRLNQPFIPFSQKGPSGCHCPRHKDAGPNDCDECNGHPGLDIRAEPGVEALAVGDGIVVESRFDPNIPANCNYPADCRGKGLGQTILLDAPGIGFVRYMHLQSRTLKDCCTPVGPVRTGAFHADTCSTTGLDPCDAGVTEGQVIGYTDNTGYSQAPHLHFEVLPFDDRANQLAIPKIDSAPCLIPPDYIGTTRNFYANVEAPPGAGINGEIDAQVAFKWSRTDFRYHPAGTWNANLSEGGLPSQDGSSNDCKWSYQDTGPVIMAGDPNAPAVQFGNASGGLFGRAYWLNKPANNPLQYLPSVTAIVNVPPSIAAKCPNGQASGPWYVLPLPWWAAWDEAYPLPDPYSYSAAFDLDDLHECNRQSSEFPGATGSWDLCASTDDPIACAATSSCP